MSLDASNAKREHGIRHGCELLSGKGSKFFYEFS